MFSYSGQWTAVRLFSQSVIFAPCHEWASEGTIGQPSLKIICSGFELMNQEWNSHGESFCQLWSSGGRAAVDAKYWLGKLSVLAFQRIYQLDYSAIRVPRAWLRSLNICIRIWLLVLLDDFFGSNKTRAQCYAISSIYGNHNSRRKNGTPSLLKQNAI